MTAGTDFLTAICDRRAIGEMREVARSDFEGEEELVFYDLCAQHLRRYGTLPTEDTIEERLDFALDPCEDHIDYYLETLMERNLHNRLVPHFNNLRTAVNERDTSVVRASIEQLGSINRVASNQHAFLSVNEIAAMSRERYEQNHLVDGLVGIPTGYQTLDEDSNGYQGGDLNMIVARPGVGKTWLLLHMIKAAVESGCNVLLATMEMSMLQIGTRFFSYAANVNPRHARIGKLGFYEQQRYLAMAEHYGRVYRDQFFIYQGGMGQGMSGVEGVIAERRPDVVFIDGVYLLRSPRTDSRANKGIQISDVLDDAKEIALRRNIPIIGTSQLNREGAGENISLETIGFTDAFSTHCSIIYALQKPHRSAEDRNTRIFRTIKGREGEDASMAINFKFNPMRFTETDMSIVRRQGEAPTARGGLGWMQSNGSENRDTATNNQ